ncbi:MAG: response regulator transcription factor [Actinomycetota bacterium]|nr:response regulator transcription factor [Actinomycetota bacterium]
MTIRLMVVDDTEHVRKMLVDMLGLHGFEVAADAGDGPEALRTVDDADPDVVIVDYRMSDMDGIEVTRRIRERRPDQHVVLYSAFIDDAVEVEALGAGVAVCVPKREGVENLAREITAVAMDLGGNGPRR